MISNDSIQTAHVGVVLHLGKGDFAMNSEIKNFTLRVDAQVLAKFRYVSRYSGRSANSQMLVMMRKVIEQFEQQNGEIHLEEL